MLPHYFFFITKTSTNTRCIIARSWQNANTHIGHEFILNGIILMQCFWNGNSTLHAVLSVLILPSLPRYSQLLANCFIKHGLHKCRNLYAFHCKTLLTCKGIFNIKQIGGETTKTFTAQKNYKQT